MIGLVSAIALLAHLDTAQAYTWVRELRPNRHPMIDTWNRFTGAPLGSPYCASFVSWCLAQAQVRWPRVRSAWSQAFRVAGSLPPYRNAAKPGTIVIWRRGSSGWQGHVGFLIRLQGDVLETIEANTSPSEAGSIRVQRDGDGVYRKRRSWRRNTYQGNAFRIVALTPVYGKNAAN